MTWLYAALVAFALLAPGAARADVASECAAIAQSRIAATNLLSSVIVPAANGLPAYCRVLGYVRPAINFEIRLPETGWNGKFLQEGCGGFCGSLENQVGVLNRDLRRGYAASTTDAGHWGQSPTDGRWAMDNPVAQADWGWRAETETARVSKVVIAELFGHGPAKSYFDGCSNGGRQALMEAQRFPNDFDGIVAGAPALDATRLAGALFASLLQANTGDDGKPIFTNAKLDLVIGAARAACADPEGFVNDPRACRFRPATLACHPGDRPETCLTAPEVATLEKWYAGPVTRAGQPLYAGGIPVGSEIFWPEWLTGIRGGEGEDMAFARDGLRYLSYPPVPVPGLLFDVARDYDIERDLPRFSAMSRVYDATNPDLSKFAARNGRLIIYQGWADAIVTPFRTVEYYDEVMKAAGGRAKAETFARLFMVPGMDHCGASNEGPGVDYRGIDPLSALEAWVEKDEAPARLITTKLDPAGKPRWSRPVCPWPQVPKAEAGADRTRAEAWSCEE
jgi:feruloyl esterase